MKAKVGFSIATSVLAMALAGTALAGEQPAEQPSEEEAEAERGEAEQTVAPSAPQVAPSAPQVAPPSEHKAAPSEQQATEPSAEQAMEPSAEQAAPPSGKEHGASGWRAPVAAPRDALEIGLSTAYTRGFGRIGDGADVGDVACDGLNLGLGLSYRISPKLSVGATTAYQTFRRGDELASGSRAQGMTAGVEASIHMMPFQRVDPVITLGTGYRLLWVQPRGSGNDYLVHGFQLAKLNAGLDIRVTKDLAIGPMVGADLDLFVWKNPAGSAGNHVLDNKGLSTFVYAGVQGRFDIGGKRDEPAPKMTPSY